MHYNSMYEIVIHKTMILLQIATLSFLATVGRRFNKAFYTNLNELNDFFHFIDTLR